MSVWGAHRTNNVQDLRSGRALTRALAAAVVFGAATACGAGTPASSLLAQPVGEAVKVCATVVNWPARLADDAWPVRVADDVCVAAGAQVAGCPVDSPAGLVRWWSTGARGYDGTWIGWEIDYQYLEYFDSHVECPTQTVTSQRSVPSGASS